MMQLAATRHCCLPDSTSRTPPYTPQEHPLKTNTIQSTCAFFVVLPCRIKERLHVKLVESGSAVISRPMDWRALGVPEWLADRAERLGFLFPTGVLTREQQSENARQSAVSNRTGVLTSHSGCVLTREVQPGDAKGSAARSGSWVSAGVVRGVCLGLE
jgi:hypothetical protein